MLEQYKSFTEKSPWNYFPNNNEKIVTRFFIKENDNNVINDNNVMYVDYFIEKENLYLLCIFVYPEYRNKNMPILGSRMMYDYLLKNELKNIKTLVYPNMDSSTKIIYELDKRRYGHLFNIVSINIEEFEEFNEKNDL